MTGSTSVETNAIDQHTARYAGSLIRSGKREMSDPHPREVAQRVFAAEFNDATTTFQESDDDRAPVYVLLPTGAKANRVFVVGTLTETEDVGDDTPYWRGRIVDPTGTMFVYAGQYQSEAADVLRETEPPEFGAVVGKARTYEPDGGMTTVSIQPEVITVVDKATRERWVVETAKRTLECLEAFDDPNNEYAQIARDAYGSDVEEYRTHTIYALEQLDETADNDQDEPPSGQAGRYEDRDLLSG